MIHVRRITTDEAGELRAVRLAALADSPAAFGSTLERELAFSDDTWAERAAASARGDRQLTLLARDTASPAGSLPVGIVGGHRDDGRPEVIHLVSMWTAPAARRQGVGAALVDGVVGWARDIGAGRVELWVVRGNGPAQQLYERAGFVVTGDHQPHPDDPCASEMRMVRMV